MMDSRPEPILATLLCVVGPIAVSLVLTVAPMDARQAPPGGIAKAQGSAQATPTTPQAGLTVSLGTSIALDTQDFCCPDYLKDTLQRIENRWDKNVRERGETVLKFVIHRDGSVSDISTEKTTSQLVELQSLSALQRAKLSPLPEAFRDDHLTVHLRFPYGIK